MSRSCPEWAGKTDDQAAPPRVRIRVFEACKGLCHRCGRKIGPADKWTLEHRIALILGGENREGNLCLTCNWCLADKNTEDVAAKSKLANIQKKHLGVANNKRPFPKRVDPWGKQRRAS